MAGENNLKERIHRGELIFGVGASLDFGRSQLEDILAQGDYSFVYVDSQHSAFSDKELVTFCSHAQAIGIPVQLRIPHTRHTYLIGRFLDFGPTGILVPEVKSMSEVDEAIEFFYYPQVGRRSWGGAVRLNIDAFSAPADPEEIDRLAYADWWNSNGYLAIQMESVEAVVNAANLAKPGIDLLAFGPNDLLFNIESLTNSPFTTVDECIGHVLEQTKDSTVQVSLGVATAEQRDKYIEMGVKVLQVTPGM